MTDLDVRGDFPVLEAPFESPVTGESLPLVYLDHGASTHAPRPVLEAHRRFLSEAYANVHRGAHHLSAVSTEAYEDVRWKVEAFLGAPDDASVVFTSNTTDALNLAAHLMEHEPGRTLVTLLEHHSNDLPHRARGPVTHIEVTPEGDVDLDDLRRELRRGDVKLVAVSAASNVSGIRPALPEIVDLAHDAGARVLVDGAQALAHLPLDLRSMGSEGPDLFAAAGHKAYAPMGSAFLVARNDLLDGADPYRPGGGVVTFVSDDDVLYVDGPERHEGGTPNVSGAVALGAALDYLRGQGMERVRAHELELLRVLDSGLRSIGGVKVLGDLGPERRVGVCTFTVEGVPHALVSTILDQEFGVATRNGCFCAHPYLVRLLGMQDRVDALRESLRAGTAATWDPEFPGAVRASLGIYNDRADVERLLEGVRVIAKRGWKGNYTFDEADARWCADARSKA